MLELYQGYTQEVRQAPCLSFNLSWKACSSLKSTWFPAEAISSRPSISACVVKSLRMNPDIRLVFNSAGTGQTFGSLAQLGAFRSCRNAQTRYLTVLII